MTVVAEPDLTLDVARMLTEKPDAATTPVAAPDAPPTRADDAFTLRLTTAMRGGDEAAFHEFFDRYYDRLLRYLIVVARGNEDAAHEAAQGLLARVARHIRPFATEPEFWRWLAAVARHALVDEQRKQNRYQRLLGRFVDAFRGDSADPDAVAADERLLALLEREVGELAAEERELIERKYFRAEPVRAIATACDKTEKSIESRLGRIRAKLKTAVL